MASQFRWLARACLCLCLLGLAAGARAECPAKTEIGDTLFNADGSPASGRVVIAWPTFLIGSCQVIAGQVSVPVTGGAFSVALYPNDAAIPAGTSYRVTYYLASGRVTTEYWVVPTAAAPVSLAAVRSSSVPFPAVMLSMAQVTNLLPALAAKVELPSPCPAGKFLQANGSSSPPQVECVDGTGAPLASATVSGTVKTDVSEADPRVYTKATADSLLAGKANAAHTHAAADVTSGTLDPARLPAPTATTLGGVHSGACSGSDKVTGISTSGAVVCGTDQTGGGGSASQHQVNGVNLAANDPVNFQDSATVAFSNPSAGNVQAQVTDVPPLDASKIASGTLAAARVPNLENLNGTLTVAKGGTGASTAADARTNLGAAGTHACSSQFLRSTTAGGGTCASVAGTDFANQNPNLLFAGPSSGAAAAPAFRALVSADLPDNGVTDTKLRDSAGFSVIGKATTGTGDPADIAVAADRLLGRDGSGDLAGIQVKTPHLTDAAVTTPKIADGAVTRDKVAAALRTRQIVFVLGADNGSALADTDDQASIYVNRLGQGVTITEVWCESDAGTPSINLQRDDGTPANILSANLSCSTSGASTTTFVAGEASIADTHRIDYLTVTAGGTAKRITVAIKFTLD